MRNRYLQYTFLFAAIFIFFTSSCEKSKEEYTEAAHHPDFIHESVKKLTDVIVYDIFSPPVASRIYAYSSIAAYEVLVNENPQYSSLAGQLNGLAEVPEPEAGKEYCFPLAALQAHLKVGEAMIFSEEKIDAYRQEVYQRFRDLGVPGEVMKNSIIYGEKVGAHILEWSDKDMYKETRTYPKFSVNDEPSRWVPTPPDYMDGIEPHWDMIRTMVLDSSNQYIPLPPTEFDMTEGSPFYKEVMEVYETGVNLNEEETEIAKFWDCNPYVSHHQGHMMFATKKITPGGHWMGIAAIASKVDSADIMKSTLAYTATSIALFDGFISCWDEKYRSNLIRPETVINKYIDEDWRPLLQTPPFPEYTSGHSVISRAAATALTSVFGDNFSYIDSVEVEYGLPSRSFNSFIEASSEAAMSRMYGGIHYLPACMIGVDQGEKVGNYVVSNIKFRYEDSNDQVTDLID